MCWDEKWDSLIRDNGLINKVKEMDEFDDDKNNKLHIKDICGQIYQDYTKYSEILSKTRKEILNITRKFSEEHIQTGRIKEMDSLLCKVINKRHAHINDKHNPYSTINGDNYKDVVSDLLGIRLIVSNKKQWINLHEKIIQRFPYASEDDAYDNIALIKHGANGRDLLAEIPKVYHAYGDDLSIYERGRLEKKLKNNGYRSVHYVVSYQRKYVEIQVRTLYEEAWSDCEHRYVYKKEEHKSYTTLKQLASILVMLTNASDVLAERMGQIYETEALREELGNYLLCKDVNLNFDIIFDKINYASQMLEEFRNKIVKGELNE